MTYSHFSYPLPRTELQSNKWVLVSEHPQENCLEPLFHAVFSFRVAQVLGVQPPGASSNEGLPYSRQSDQIRFEAPLNSLLSGREMFFLRGWSQFGSCVKGFNALGLIAEHAYKELKYLESCADDELRPIVLGFLKSRSRSVEGRLVPVFTGEELTKISSLTIKDLKSVPLLHLALWRSYAQRTIVCSTSSNMGISLHESLRYMQQRSFEIFGKSYHILNQTEGSLIIWCPDENADFMNADKTKALRAIEAEKPELTSLHTYINRLQRDPGALGDALLLGGYFFPTNPQSRDEIENLISRALQEICESQKITFEDALRQTNIRQCLDSLGAKIESDRVWVRSGVMGGLYGLMIPYLLMLEEALGRGFHAVSTWNQASIGAALAAAVLADMKLRDFDSLPEATRRILSEEFPNVFKASRSGKIGMALPTAVHGTFDIANLQSLAQLYGVVLDRHLSGRATAFVGLGSSSYANGNSVFEILNACIEKQGCFEGRDSLHPATHAINPIAQALIFGEDLVRVLRHCGGDLKKAQSFVLNHVMKPEPAGAASLAGYLLARLDRNTLSFVEISLVLRLMGFTRERLLTFANYGNGPQAFHLYVQDAYEEGSSMGSFVESVLLTLDWDLDTLLRASEEERIRGRLRYAWKGLDRDDLEQVGAEVNIYLTGDHCAQPEPLLVNELLESVHATYNLSADLLQLDLERRAKSRASQSIRLLKSIERGLEGIERGYRTLNHWCFERVLRPLVSERWEKKYRISSQISMLSTKTSPLPAKDFEVSADQSSRLDSLATRPRQEWPVAEQKSQTQRLSNLK